MWRKNFKIFQDEKLKMTIEEKIIWDKRVSIRDLKVDVKNGFVTLIGKVDSEFKKQAAYTIAKTTEGVFWVNNEVQIVPNQYRSDNLLQAIIRDEIYKLGLSSTEYINIEVVDGIVKLEGIVHDSKKKGYAAGIVWALSSVKDCLNYIEISPPHTPEFAMSAPDTYYNARPKNSLLAA